MTILTNATLLDVIDGQLRPNQTIQIDNGRIASVTSDTLSADERTYAETNGHDIIDVGGRTVMPGLCDAHVHVIAWTANISEQTRHSSAYTTARAAEILNDMLMRGFTTVRDCAGADYGIAQAVDEGFLTGPRVLFCGRALSQTGGHGDVRGRGEQMLNGYSDLTLSQLANGVPEVRAACRDEIRKGAHHIKLMLSGGVASPTDRLTNNQFALEEIRAAVEEAEMAGIYVTGHTYTVPAVNRAIECGVRSLEHCNLIDETSVELLLEHDAFMVPTLATYEALSNEGADAGLQPEMLEKLTIVRDKGLYALDPVSGNMGCVPPEPGFLEGLRAICDETGTLLVFDEVMTGFRLAPGGAQERYGVTPDLTTLGKIIGGGLPVGAFGGRADIMAMVAPSGPVYQAGTLSGNPLATAAGNAMLRWIAEHPEIYDHVEALGAKMDQAFARMIAEHGWPITWLRVGAMGSLFFGPGPIRDWPTVESCSLDRFAAWFAGMLEEGFYMAPSPFEASFLSAAHTEHDIDRFLEAAERTLTRVHASDSPAPDSAAEVSA